MDKKKLDFLTDIGKVLDKHDVKGVVVVYELDGATCNTVVARKDCEVDHYNALNHISDWLHRALEDATEIKTDPNQQRLFN